MDFFDRQEQARRGTRRLVVLFLLAVVGVVVAVNLAVILIFFGVEAKTGHELAETGIVRADVAVWVTAATLAVMATGTGYKTLALARGGEAVAEMLGGRPLDPNTDVLAERRLLNVVEEMALASGVPVPTVYLLADERSINAFAAGHATDDAVIGVTGGTLDHLTRDELQGVIAHEFSHILNGDMRLNMRLIGILHGILVIGLIGYWILRSARFSSSRKKGGNAFGLLGLALFVTGYAGVFFGKLIKSAVSRQREYLADASAVQFTRNPDGLGSALKKIGGLAAGSRIDSPNAEQASHLFFGNGLGKPAFAWMATHPPLVERIRRLDPSFDGRFPPLEAPQPEPPAEDGKRDEQERGRQLIEKIAVLGAVLGGAAGREAVSRIGSPTREHLDYAGQLLESLPDALIERAREPSGARSLVLGLLIDLDDPAVRAHQLKLLARDPELRDEVAAALPLLQDCPLEVRLPLLDLAIPALRRISNEQYTELEAWVDELVAADRRTSLFEFALSHLLARHLRPTFHPSRRRPAQYYGLTGLRRECSTLLSALARFGAEDGEEAAAALAAGSAKLASGRLDVELLDADACTIDDLEGALERLAEVAPRLKRDLIEACLATVAHDDRVTLAETELLRAIADALDCPVPPVLTGRLEEAGRVGRSTPAGDPLPAG